MIQACQNGDVDIVLFTKLDRFFRSVGDYYACIDQMNGVPWRAIWEDYETETSSGIFKVNIMLSVSQSEADRTSERIKSVMDYKRKRKELVSGHMPRGYMIKDKRPAIDPETKDQMNAFFRTYLETASMKKAREAAAKYGQIIEMSTASFILRNAKAYTGLIQGIKCDPYITQDECDLILSTRKEPRRQTEHQYIFSGLLYCAECGRRLGGHNQYRKRTKSLYCYYNCTRHYNSSLYCTNGVNISEEVIEDHLLQSMDEIIAGATAECEQKEKEKKKTNNDSKIKALKARRERAWNAYLDGIIEKEEFAEKIAAIDQAIADLEVPDQHEEKKQNIISISKLLPAGWQELYKGLDTTHKYKFWTQVVRRIVIDNERNIKIEL